MQIPARDLIFGSLGPHGVLPNDVVCLASNSAGPSDSTLGSVTSACLNDPLRLSISEPFYVSLRLSTFLCLALCLNLGVPHCDYHLVFVSLAVCAMRVCVCHACLTGCGLGVESATRMCRVQWRSQAESTEHSVFDLDVQRHLCFRNLDIVMKIADPVDALSADSGEISISHPAVALTDY